MKSLISKPPWSHIENGGICRSCFRQFNEEVGHARLCITCETDLDAVTTMPAFTRSEEPRPAR